jgi:hypothetical protein
LYLEFKYQVEEELMRIVIRWKTSKAREGDVSRREMLKSRLERLAHSQKHRENYRSELMFFAGCKLLKPHRLVNLTAEEEEVRCHVTWQEFDSCRWLAGCADAAYLAGEAPCPDDFVAHRKELILGFSDQVPFG